MTHLQNDPAVFMEEMLEGFSALYPQYVSPVPGGVIRSTQSPKGKVSVIVGGGSGHYPAFCGVVGPGFADGAVVGNIFTSPSAQDAYNVGVASENGGGVLFITGNYAGDVLNFNQAQARMISEGYKVKNFYVTDDVASAPRGEKAKRRGIAGDFTVFKIASAAAEAGLDLENVERLAIHSNELTRTLGVAFAGCTLPGAPSALFSVPAGKMGLGLGIHGEPGISEDDLPTAKHLAEILVEGAIAELKDNPIRKIAVILNGLGATKYEELFVTWRSVNELLINLGYEIIEPEVGEIVTSLDMAGCSLTIMLLDDELEPLWRASCDTPAYKKGSSILSTLARKEKKIANKVEHARLSSTEFSHKAAIGTLQILEDALTTIVSAEKELGKIDAVAGDGDHGRGMVKGISAAVEAAQEVVSNGGGIASLLIEAGESWAAKAGGTSGVLWGGALVKAGEVLSNEANSISDREIVSAVTESIYNVKSMGKAEIGDKTMLDSMIPFADTLMALIKNGDSIVKAWGLSADVAEKSAQATSSLSPKIGRARPLAAKSVGTPDAGAVSFALIVKSVHQSITRE
jgi:dihydroxyacetone kinase